MSRVWKILKAVAEWIILVPVAIVFTLTYAPFILIGYAFAMLWYMCGGPNPVLKNVDLNKTQGR